MFRLAEDKEIVCLLQSFGVKEIPGCARAPTSEEQKAYKKSLMELVRSSMLRAGFKYIPHQLKQDARLIPEVERVTGMRFKDTCMACPDCESICLNFAEGVIAVLERDFIQLTHGERSDLFERSGIQFLLTGITLGLLYVSVPAKQGLDELILAVLILMMKVDRWVQALQLYGPAPEPRPPPKQLRSLTMSKEEVHMRRHYSQRERRSLGADVTAPKPPRPLPAVALDHCVECKKPFENGEALQECDCLAVTVRYAQYCHPSVGGAGAAAAAGPVWGRQASAADGGADQERPRANTL